MNQKNVSRNDKKRCRWAMSGNEHYMLYHDREWGAPVYDDRRQFEFLVLEGAQAGLSWALILNKRDNYRRAFADFDAVKVARFSTRKIDSLLRDPGIVRNRRKVEATVTNARAFLRVVDEFGSFSTYIWDFIRGAPVQNRRRSGADMPALTPESTMLAADLKRRGFQFVGPIVIYSHMQATGIVNDHEVHCFRYKECAALGKELIRSR